MSPSASDDKGLRRTGGVGSEEESPWNCETLIRTHLFADTAAVTPAANADATPLIRGGLRTAPRGGNSKVVGCDGANVGGKYQRRYAARTGHALEIVCKGWHQESSMIPCNVVLVCDVS